MSDVAIAFWFSVFFMLKVSLLKNTHLGKEEKVLREQEHERLKNEERFQNEKISKVSLPFAPFCLYSITNSPSMRLLLLAITA